ncbi:YraN family protein [Nigerium massiliense]|uniref:YraN family protein n=1 Tax=Nigerium massiliense TaxID=1522317 RepID=UPI00058E3C3D|nr:YraN family protein [Nigerium massiliense]
MTKTTTDPRRATGKDGEDLAANYVTGLGWTVLARNWRCRVGEIDLIARDDEGALVVCEVKTRRGLGFGDPLESITYAKVRRLRELTVEFLRECGETPGRVRLDAIGLLLDRDGNAKLSHVRGIDA